MADTERIEQKKAYHNDVTNLKAYIAREKTAIDSVDAILTTNSTLVSDVAKTDQALADRIAAALSETNAVYQQRRDDLVTNITSGVNDINTIRDTVNASSDHNQTEKDEFIAEATAMTAILTEVTG
jgi:phage antirepressor YoqD-like protein